MRGAFSLWIYLLCALEIVFVFFDHLLNHLTADGACLTCSEITVVALVKVYAYFACCLHLELVECLLCLGNEGLIASCHGNGLLFRQNFCLSRHLNAVTRHAKGTAHLTPTTRQGTFDLYHRDPEGLATAVPRTHRLLRPVASLVLLWAFLREI